MSNRLRQCQTAAGIDAIFLPFKTRNGWSVALVCLLVGERWLLLEREREGGEAQAGIEGHLRRPWLLHCSCLDCFVRPGGVSVRVDHVGWSHGIA